jgi:opacity protein-like surface antigen
MYQFRKIYCGVFILFVLFLIAKESQAQKEQGISINIGSGVSEYSIVGGKRIGDDDWNQFGLHYTGGLAYYHALNKIELGISSSIERHQTILKGYTEYELTFKPDSFVFVGTTGTQINSMYYINLTTSIKYNFIEKEKHCFYIGFGLGANHVFKEKCRFYSVSEANPENNIDTTYYNNNINKIHKIVASARLSSGVIFDLSDKIQLQTEVFYSSFLHNYWKTPNYLNTWNRPYNIGMRFSLRYSFGNNERKTAA